MTNHRLKPSYIARQPRKSITQYWSGGENARIAEATGTPTPRSGATRGARDSSAREPGAHVDEAQRLGDRALESSPCHPRYAANALHLLGDIATHPDRFDAESGEAHYRQALALAEPRGVRPLVAHCHLGLAKFYRRTGKYEHAQERFTTATTRYREMRMTYWLEKAEVEIRELA